MQAHTNGKNHERPSATCQSIDWYCEGEERIVALEESVVTIRFVGRKGRRARIAIEVPTGASISSPE